MDGLLQGVEAVIEGQWGLLVEQDDSRLISGRKHGRGRFGLYGLRRVRNKKFRVSTVECDLGPRTASSVLVQLR